MSPKEVNLPPEDLLALLQTLGTEQCNSRRVVIFEHLLPDSTYTTPQFLGGYSAEELITAAFERLNFEHVEQNGTDGIIFFI